MSTDSLSPIEIVNSRDFPIPRTKLFELFENPDHLVHWWGPKGFTNTFQRFEFRTGGVWNFTMTSPDGAKYELEKHFVEVAPPERIVLDHPQPMHSFRMTMTFTEKDPATTTLTWKMAFEPVPEPEKLATFIRAANEENFDRLQAYLAALSVER